MSSQCLPPSLGSIRQCLEADLVWRFSRWPPWRPFGISELNDFSNSDSLCCSDASHLQLKPTYGLGGDVVWRFSRWPTWRPSWISEQNDLHVAQILPPPPPPYPPPPTHTHTHTHSTPSLGSVWLRCWEPMWFQTFQDGRSGGQFGWPNGMILAILNLYVSPMLPIKFRLNPTYGLGGDVVWTISRWPPWRPSWISERTISAILNLYVAPMPPIKFRGSKFRLNPTYGLGGDVVWTISRWPPWGPSWISERNYFSYSESLCCSDASHQVSAQSLLRFGNVVWRISRSMAAILDIEMEPFWQFWISMSLNLTYGLGGDVVWRISNARAAILNIGTERF